MTAFLRALADRRGLAPEPDLRWPYQPPAVVDTYPQPLCQHCLAGRGLRAARFCALNRAERMREGRRPCA